MGRTSRLTIPVMRKFQYKTVEEIAEDLEEEVSVIRPIYDITVKYAPECDPESVFHEVEKL